MRGTPLLFLLALPACELGTDLGEYGRLEFGGADYGDTTFLADQGVKPTAIGGTQRIEVFDADSGAPFDAILDADVGSHLALGAIDGNLVEVRGVSEGSSRLRIKDGDNIVDAIELQATTAAAVELTIDSFWAVGPFDVASWAAYQGGEAFLVAAVLDVSGDRLVDEGVTLAATAPDGAKSAWDTLRIPAVPDGDFEVTIEAAGPPAATFPVPTIASIEEVAATRLGDAVVCLHARQGDVAVVFVPWEVEVEGATRVATMADGEAPPLGCVALEHEAPGSITVTATEPGGLSATISFEVSPSD